MLARGSQDLPSYSTPTSSQAPRRDEKTKRARGRHRQHAFGKPRGDNAALQPASTRSVGSREQAANNNTSNRAQTMLLLGLVLATMVAMAVANKNT